jgi:hypothetical protein
MCWRWPHVAPCATIGGRASGAASNLVACEVENVLTMSGHPWIHQGSCGEAPHRRAAFQCDTESELAAVVRRLAQRRVGASEGGDQSAPGVACEPLLPDGAARAAPAGGPS